MKTLVQFMIVGALVPAILAQGSRRPSGSTPSASTGTSTTPAPPSPPTYAPLPPIEDGGAFPEPVDYPESECDKDEDCPKFHYCSFSLWFPGGSCVSSHDPENPGQDCGVMTPDGKTKIPDSNVCINAEIQANTNAFGEFDPKYSTSRCYKEFGYKCAMAFYMPCVQNYDKSGKPIAGEEKSCPNKFKCEEVRYAKDGVQNVCRPIQPDYFREIGPEEDECKDNFDCGFNILGFSWNPCEQVSFTDETTGKLLNLKICGQGLIEKK